MLSAIFGIAAAGVGVGIAIFLFVVLPLFAYTLPYFTWRGWNSGTKGIPKQYESNGFKGAKWLFHNIANATKLYRSWFTKQPHGITKF